MEVLGGQQIKNVMNCPENRYLFVTPPPPLRGWRERGGREGGDRAGEREREARREGGAGAKPGNQLVYNNIIKKL